MPDGRATNGGKRKGSGRPSGAKDVLPRITRKDVIQSRREDWDKWEKRSGLLKKVFDRLEHIILDDKVNPREAIKAAELIYKYGYGLPEVAAEHQPEQILYLIRNAAPLALEGGPDDDNTIEGEWTNVSTVDAEAG